MAEPPLDGMTEDIKEFVREIEAERQKRDEAPPRDLWGLVSLLPRRALAIALSLTLMALSASATYIVSDNSKRSGNDAETLRLLVTEVIPNMNGKISSLEVKVSGLEGSEVRFDREAEDTRKEIRATKDVAMETRAAVARLEGKLDRMAR